MKCINSNPGFCRFKLCYDCLRIGGPPPQCVREGQTPAPEINEPPEAEIVQQGTAQDATQEVLRSLKWMERDMDFRRSQTGLDGDALSPEMQDVRRIISEMQAGTLIVTRVQTERSQ